MTDDEARALDIEIAEKIFGWKRVDRPDERVSPGHGSLGDSIDWQRKGPHPRLESPDGEGSHYLCPCAWGHGRSGHIDLPHYSTDIAEAWKIWEELAAANDWEMMGLTTTNAHVAIHQYRVWIAGDCPAAEAICRAALATVL